MPRRPRKQPPQGPKNGMTWAIWAAQKISDLAKEGKSANGLAENQFFTTVLVDQMDQIVADLFQAQIEIFSPTREEHLEKIKLFQRFLTAMTAAGPHSVSWEYLPIFKKYSPRKGDASVKVAERRLNILTDIIQNPNGLPEIRETARDLLCHWPEKIAHLEIRNRKESEEFFAQIIDVLIADLDSRVASDRDEERLLTLLETAGGKAEIEGERRGRLHGLTTPIRFDAAERLLKERILWNEQSKTRAFNIVAGEYTSDQRGQALARVKRTLAEIVNVREAKKEEKSQASERIAIAAKYLNYQAGKRETFAKAVETLPILFTAAAQCRKTKKLDAEIHKTAIALTDPEQVAEVLRGWDDDFRRPRPPYDARPLQAAFAAVAAHPDVPEKWRDICADLSGALAFFTRAGAKHTQAKKKDLT